MLVATRKELREITRATALVLGLAAKEAVVLGDLIIESPDAVVFAGVKGRHIEEITHTPREIIITGSWTANTG